MKRYFSLSHILIYLGVAISILLFFFFFKSSSEVTAKEFAGFVVEINKVSNPPYINVEGFPVIGGFEADTSEVKKIIVTADTIIERVTEILSEKAGVIDSSEIKKETSEASFNDLKAGGGLANPGIKQGQGSTIIVFSNENIFYRKEFTAKRIQIRTTTTLR